MKGCFSPLLHSVSLGHLALICLSDQRSFNQRNTDPQLHFSDNQTFHGFLPEKVSTQADLVPVIPRQEGTSAPQLSTKQQELFWKSL